MQDEQPQASENPPEVPPEVETPPEPVVETVGAQTEPPHAERITIPCSCGMTYTYDVTPDTDEFTSVCLVCGTRSKWSR